MANISREERERRRLAGEEAARKMPMPTTALMESDPLGEATTTEVAIVEPKTQQPPSFSVAERRLKHGDMAMLSQQAEVELVGLPETMSIYWGLTEDAHELITLRGWVPVEAKYLPMKAERMGLTCSPDGNVTRGKNGSEMLFMMPERLRNDILFDQANRRQVSRLSRRHHLQQAINSAQADANNAALPASRRESAARSAAMMESSQKAKFTFTEYTESHSRNTSPE